MIVTAIKTHKITKKDTIFAIFDTYIKDFPEKSVLVVASKIIALCEGRAIKLTEEEKEALIKKEASYYIPKEKNKYGLFITIKENYLTHSSGIDESNVADGDSVLWPKNPQKSANAIRRYLVKKYRLKNTGVIISDMAVIPLQKGLMAGAIAYSGFKPFKDITDTEDVFGRKFKYSWEGHLQGIAAAAGVVMGEGAEQTPLGIVTDIPFVEFTANDPTEKELQSIAIKPDQDLYGQLLTAVNWRKGGA